MKEITFHENVLAKTKAISQNIISLDQYLTNDDLLNFYNDLFTFAGEKNDPSNFILSFNILLEKYSGLESIYFMDAVDIQLNFKPSSANTEAANDTTKSEQNPPVKKEDQVVVAIENEVVDILKNMREIYNETIPGI